MVLFCEDCGEKNDLDTAAFIDGKAVFKCSVCNYPNAYSITHLTESEPPDTRACFFEEIQSASGMVGGFLYDHKQGVIGRKMPSILAKSDIDTLGAGLSRSYDQAGLFCPDLEKITVVIADKYFSVFKVGGQLYAVVVAGGPGLPESIVERIADL